jgi:protein TonB
MFSIVRSVRSTLGCPPVPASFYVAGVAFACAAAAQAASSPPANDSAVTARATLEFRSCAKPQYPKADLEGHHEGAVTLGFLVDENGRVMVSKVMESSGFATLDEAARSALATCGFLPALDNGKPVQQWTSVKYVWTLR